MRFKDRLINLQVVQGGGCAQRLVMDSNEDGSDSRLVRVNGRIRDRHGVPFERDLKLHWNQSFVVSPLAPNSNQAQPILPNGQMAHLPSDMGNPARRLEEPVRFFCLLEQAERIVAGKTDLLDGELQARHGNSPQASGVALAPRDK